jgi:hypothetical protein
MAALAPRTMSRSNRHHAGLVLAVIAALLQAFAIPLAHGRISPDATSDVCTVQGVRSGPTDAPTPPDDAYQHCALCVHAVSAGVHAVRQFLPRAGTDDESPRFDGDVWRAAARIAVRGARAPPVVYSA